MTNNQREFQKEINRIQRELAQLQKQHHFKHIAPLPEQPKRITRRHIEELKGLSGRHFIGEAPKSTKRKSADNEPSIRKQTKKYDEPSYKTRQKKEDVYDNPKTKGRRKVRKDFGTKRDTESPLKGIKRGSLTPEESARRNAKRLETLSKSNKPRKTRKDKGIKRGSRTSTPTPEQYPTFSPAEAIIDRLRNADMLNKLNQGNEELNSFCDVLESRGVATTQKLIDDVEQKRLTRTGYFYDLIQIVESNASNTDYNALLKERESEIENAISGIIYGSGGYLATNTQADYYYNELLSLLSTSEPTLEEKKAINESSEEFMDADFDWSDISER